MIEIIQKDITTVSHGIVAHGVNCRHKMASGIALAIRNKWPEVYQTYMEAQSGEQMLGTAHFIEIADPANLPFDVKLFVVNCYTQAFYGYDGSKYADEKAIAESLISVFNFADVHNLDVYLPKIGCGLGGLDWETMVLPIIADIDTRYNKNNTTYICLWE